MIGWCYTDIEHSRQMNQKEFSRNAICPEWETENEGINENKRETEKE